MTKPDRRFLRDGISAEEAVALYRALGFATIKLYPENEVAAGAAKLYGRVRQIVLAHGLEDRYEAKEAMRAAWSGELLDE